MRYVGEIDSDLVDSDDKVKDNLEKMSPFHGEPLPAHLEFNDDIPDMECFKETSSQEETVRDNLPLYQNSTISVGESSLLVMAFAFRHKLSSPWKTYWSLSIFTVQNPTTASLS